MTTPTHHRFSPHCKDCWKTVDYRPTLSTMLGEELRFEWREREREKREREKREREEREKF